MTPIGRCGDFTDTGPLINYINMKAISCQVSGYKLDAFLNTILSKTGMEMMVKNGKLDQ